jgi:hypothetical protein
MEPLKHGHPGKHECWEELAEHAFTHDDLPRRLHRVHFPPMRRLPRPRRHHRLRTR